MIFLPSVSSVYSFFFYCFMIFFRLDFKKSCSFKSSFVDFFFVKLQVFIYFSLMRGIFNDSILFVDVLQISSFEGLIFEIFHWLFLVNDVRWGRNWGWIFVQDVDVRDNFRALYWIISWNMWKCFLRTWFYWVLGDDCCWSCMNL